jgi:hypothetical protein
MAVGAEPERRDPTGVRQAPFLRESKAVLEFVFEIRPDGRAWILAPQGEAGTLRFATFDQAERRARFLAVRQDVRGLPTRIEIMDACGGLVGAWQGERYRPVTVVGLRHAA